MSDDPMITVKQAALELGISRTTLWKMYTHYKTFPKPERISPGRVGYRLSTVEAHKGRKVS